MTTLIYLQIPVPEPIPGILFQCPIRSLARNPCLTHHLMKNRLNCRIVSVDLRGYALLTFASMTTRIDCDRFFYPNVSPPTLTNLNELGY